MVSFTPTIPVELIVWVTLSLLLFIAGLHQLWRSSSKKKNKSQQGKKLPLPPGRFGLPFVGETLEFLGSLRKGVPWQFFDDRIAAYGETFKTSLLASRTVVLAGPLGNKTVFSNTYTSWPASVVSVLGDESLTGCVGHRATRIRNALMVFLRPEALQRYTSRADRIALAFIRDHLEGESKVALFPLMKKLMFTIACEVLVGRRDREDQDKLHRPFDTMVEGLFQLPINIPGTAYSKAIAASDAIRKHLQVWIDERRRDMAAGLVTGHEDILSGFLAYKDEHGQPFSDKEVKDNILTLLCAGHETSASVATMAGKYLAANPNIMDEVYRGRFCLLPLPNHAQFFLDQCTKSLMILYVFLSCGQRTRRSLQARPLARY